MADLKAGSEFAGHRIDGVAGRGGMGVVYRAVHLALNRTVAVKVLTAELARDPQFRDRFRVESELAASIDHANVVPIFDGGEEDGLPFVTMRYVDGTDLRELAARAPLEPRRAAAIVAAAGAALDAAHARGLVHRDVKPGNVLIEDPGGREHVYLTDFGLTKEVSGDPGLTETGNWVGTVDYAAPEQIRGKPVDARADVYALGGVLYWALTGRVPYPRDTDLAKMNAHLHEAPPRLGGPLGAVIERAMAKDPRARFESAGELGRAALRAAREAEPAGARGRRSGPEADTRPLPVARGARRRRALILAAVACGAAVVLAALALAGAFSGGGESSPTTSGAPSGRTPTNAEVGRFLQTYANRYGARDAAGLGELFAPGGVRRNAGGPPQGRAAAVAAYRGQFAGLRNASYRLSDLRQRRRPGAASVSGRYAIVSDAGTTTGRVAFALVLRDDRLRIRRLDVSPDRP